MSETNITLPDGSIWANVFQKDQLTDYSTIKYSEEEYRTAISDVSNENNPILESRSVGAETFVMPSRAYLLVKAQLVEDDNASPPTPYGIGDNIALVNGWQAFRKVEIYMNGTLVDYTDFPGHVDTVLGLLNDERAYNTKGTVEYRYYDDQHLYDKVNTPPNWDYRTNIGGISGLAAANPPTQAEFNQLVANELYNNNVNTGQAGRVAHSSTGSHFWFKLPLNNVLGICKVDKPLRGVQIQIRLTKETDMKRVLLKGADSVDPFDTPDNGKLIISKISMYMPSAKPHMREYEKLNPKLVSGQSIPFDYQRIWCNEYPGKTSGEISERVLSNARRPRHVFLCIQDKKRFDDQLINPLTFDRPTSIVGHVRVGNQQFPAYDYNSNNDGYIRMYNAFLDATGKNLDRSSNSFLTFERWKNIYPIMYFDCSANDSQFEAQQDAEIVCNLTATGVPADYKLVAIVISDEHKSISEKGSSLIIQSSTA